MIAVRKTTAFTGLASALVLLTILFAVGCESITRTLRAPISAIQKPFDSTPDEDQEAQIGRQFAREARRQLKIIKLGEVNDYVNEIGQKLLAVLGPQPYNYHFTVIEDPQLNAFAVPGGYIYVHSALIERAESVDELAGVLGHEIGHVRAHHLFKQMRKARLLSGLSLAAIILSGGNQAATVGSQAFQEQLMLNFSRDFEREADQLGLNDMYKAGFNPQAMVSFFEKILLEQRFNPAQVPPYLLMHPLTQDRIATVGDLMRVLHMDQDRSSAAPAHFGRIQAMIKSQTMRGDDAAQEYLKKIQKEPNRSEWHQFLGIIYLQNRQYEQARSAYEQARSLSPADPFVHSDLGVTYLNLGRIGEARSSLQRSLELNPNDARAYNTLGKVALRQKSWQEAISYNQTALRLSPEMPEAYYDIGAAYSELGDPKEAYYFLGVAYRYMEEKERSLQYFDKALKLFGKDSSRGRMILKAMGEVKQEG